VHTYPAGSWGPTQAADLVQGHGRWHGPWLTT
jgi:glucose-6-phosphate 1-dehydrogenase